MTNILELAKQVGNCAFKTDGGRPYFSFTPDELEKFATLVRNSALEEAAQKCGHIGNTDDYCTAMTMVNAIQKLKEPTP